jgi:hypothetical protein
MKKELEFKQLSAYLPYKVPVFFSTDREVLSGLKDYYIDGVTCSDNLIHVAIEKRRFSVDFSYIQPILRPPTDLTKEIEVNGEKFVPIVKLFELTTCSEDDVIRYEQFSQYCYRLIFLHDGEEKDFFIDAKNFDIQCDINIFNQKEYFEKLAEWHFGLQEYFDNGLAIDINTIQK